MTRGQEKANKADMVRVCYRLHNQHQEVDNKVHKPAEREQAAQGSWRVIIPGEI